MAKFNADEAAAAAAIQQVINEWGHELDQNSGIQIREAGVLTDDVQYFVGEEWHNTLESVSDYYRARWDRLSATDAGPLVMRHVQSNFKVAFTSSDSAAVSFLLVFFAKAGTPPFPGYCDPLALADVQMECRSDGSGDWKISRFDSTQIFQRG